MSHRIKIMNELLGRHRLSNFDITYAVPGEIPLIRQPSDNTCWAAVSAMMRSWKDGEYRSIEETLAFAPPQYLARLYADEGLSSSEKSDFLSSLSMQAEAPQNYTVEGWLSLLTQYGILWVTTNEGTDQNFAIHARIIWGITGDGSRDLTFFAIIDPDHGIQTSENVTTFTNKFESVARADFGAGADLRPQVVHF